jgi:hypothetical protein
MTSMAVVKPFKKVEKSRNDSIINTSMQRVIMETDEDNYNESTPASKII